MIVAAHGNVDAYCEAHGMVIGERYSGKLEEYRGNYLILVTDNCSDKHDYYYLKYLLLKRKVELISTHWESRDIDDFVMYLNQREQESRKHKYGGRMAFGFQRKNGKAALSDTGRKVALRICELWDAGATYKAIQADDEVRHLDGRKIPISTIQMILKNRSKYENDD